MLSNQQTRIVQLVFTLAITSTPTFAQEVPKRFHVTPVLTQDEKMSNYDYSSVRKSTPLKISDNSGYPFAQFDIYFTPDGNGHLQARDNSEYPQKTIFKEQSLLIWEQRISFNIEKNKLTALSLSSAEKLFGKAKKTAKANSIFYTFEVPNIPGVNTAQQIYKIDMKFDNNDIIQSYRVSGPQVHNPTWVSD